jgi:siroheme synthase (precorrin-2 oxidase/ferrochelatase)
LEQQGINLLPRRGFGIDIADFEFSMEGLRIGIEAKGYSKHPHKVQGIIEQIKRYLKHNDLVVLIVHSHGLKSQVKHVMSVVEPRIRRRVILLKIAEINSLFEKIDEKIEQAEEEL